MEYTQNYALRKPGLNEYANVGDLNFNADKIDSQMKKNQDVDGEVYDPTSTSANAYEAGDYVINPDDGLMYVCKDTTYGTWDSTKWDHTTEFEEIQKAMASGGESELADLTDVEITNPTDGQALLYDPTSDKWHNSDLPDADVTKEASGNPIEFSDGADAPLVKCVTQITGSQDLHGYDKPWVGGAGKNKANISSDTVTTSQTYNCTPTYSNNGVIATATGEYGRIGYTVPVTSGQTITISLYASKDSGVYGRIIFNNTEDWNSPAYGYKDAVTTRTKHTVTVTTTSNVLFIGLYVTTTQSSGTLTVEDVMVEYNNQATAFSPYSNICPITAYTEGEIEVRGKNLFNGSFEQGTIVNGDDRANTNTIRFANQLLLKSGTYTVSIKSSKTLQTSIVLYDSNGDWVRDLDAQWHSLPYTFTLTSSYNVRFVVNYASGTLTPTEVSEFQIERGTRATPYEPYTATTHTTTFPYAIYRGSEDVVNGEVECEKKKITISSGVRLYGTYGAENANLWYFDVSDNIAVYNTKDAPLDNKLVSNMYAPISTESEFDMGDFEIRTNAIAPINRIYFRDSRFSTEAEINTYLSSNPLEVVYKLATPTTSSVTPTNLPIKSLSGYNHIESSTGDMEIEYFPQKEQPLIDLIPEASNMHEYSTAEHAVGTWIDGETIYEKTYTYSGNVAANPFQTTIDMTGKNIIEVIPHYARYTYDGGQSYGECIGSELWNVSSGILDIKYDPAPYTLRVYSFLGNATESYDIAFTLRYTKTSSNNRSLAKSAPTEETKEEQVEEIKEEPTEEVKEEPEEEVEEVKEEVKEEETKEPEDPEIKETNEEEAKR